MKKVILTTLIFTILTVPAVSRAQPTVEEQYRASLMMLVSLLLEQIELLKAQLAEMNATAAPAVSERLPEPPRRTVSLVTDLVASEFYDGSYTGLYETYGSTLIPLGTTRTRELHTTLWSRFVTLAGTSYVTERVQEFRTYRDGDAFYDAFTDLDPRTGKWILGFNTYDIDLSRPHEWYELEQLMLHEIGHMVVDDMPEMRDRFIALFWDDMDMAHADRVAGLSPGSRQDTVVREYYEDNERDFVSAYAATSPLEDIVESYVAFLTLPMPTGNYERDEKVLFFQDYPLLAAERNRIRPILTPH